MGGFYDFLIGSLLISLYNFILKCFLLFLRVYLSVSLRNYLHLFKKNIRKQMKTNIFPYLTGKCWLLKQKGITLAYCFPAPLRQIALLFTNFFVSCFGLLQFLIVALDRKQISSLTCASVYCVNLLIDWFAIGYISGLFFSILKCGQCNLNTIL